MKTMLQCFRGGWPLLVLVPWCGWAAETFPIFGLQHTPVGNVSYIVEGETLYLYRADGEAEGDFGVSIELGEADAGLWGSLDTYNTFTVDGGFTRGRMYGQLDGQPDTFICSLTGRTIDYWNGYFQIGADFRPLGSSSVTYQVYDGSEVVAVVTNCTSPVTVSTWSESSPQANPLLRLPDGSLAAVVRFSSTVPLYLEGYDPDGGEGTDTVAFGDRLVIRPEGVSGVVDFASRMEVTAGNGEHRIDLTQERLGVFNRSHRALGDALFHAASGTLRVSHVNPLDADQEIGVSIELEGARQFHVGVDPVDTHEEGASLAVSAIGSCQGQGGDSLGLAGIRNLGGAVEAFADFSEVAASLQINIYRMGALVGTVPATNASVTVSMSGAPRVLGFEGNTSLGDVLPGLGVELEDAVVFALPGGASLEGDRIVFRPLNASRCDGLASLSLTWHNVDAVTIVDETGLQTVSLVDYLPEVTAPAFLKKFVGHEPATVTEVLRRPSFAQREGRTWVTITDRVGETNVSSAVCRLDPDGLRYFGGEWEAFELSSHVGLRMLPDLITVGQAYFSMGSFLWRDKETGMEYPVEVSSVTTVAAFQGLEVPALPANLQPVLRVEWELSFGSSGAPNAPVARFGTNWLIVGVGVIQYAERDVFDDGTERLRRGELADYVILKTRPAVLTANVGANVRMQAEVVNGPAGGIREWSKDGSLVLSNALARRLDLANLRAGDAGTYAVVVGLPWGGGTARITSEIGWLRVIPFSDTPPFWASVVGSGSQVHVLATAVDTAGNLYVAGNYYYQLDAGTNHFLNRGGSDVFLAKLNPVGELLWVRVGGGIYNDSPCAVGADAAGNVYLAGNFSGTATFGPFTLTSPVRPDPLFVTKLDPGGNFLWAAQSLGTGNTYCTGMAADSDGSLYLLGGFSSGTAILGGTTLSNASWRTDMFLARLNAAGQFQWAKPVLHSGNSIYPRSVAVDTAGAIYLTGEFQDQITFGSTMLTSAPYYRAGFLAKANANGLFLWARKMGNSTAGIVTDTQDQVYVSGDFAGTLQLDAVTLSGRPSSGEENFVAKLTSGGAVLWAKASPHPLNYYGLPLTVDSQGYVYVGGGFYDQATYEGTTFYLSGDSSSVLTKMDAAGQVLWNKQLSGSRDNVTRSLTRDHAGNVYLAGDFSTSVNCGETNLTTTASQSTFVVKITGATAPTLTQSPQSQTVNRGEPATFSASASGTELLLYQWRKDGQDLLGAIGASFTLASAQTSDAGAYSVVVRNAGGIVVSPEAALQVLIVEAGTLTFVETNYVVTETNILVAVDIQRSGSTSAVALVDFITVDGTAVAGEDYWDTAITLRFEPGEIRKTAFVAVVDDPAQELNETVVLRLANPGIGTTVGQPDTAVLLLVDNDPASAPVIRSHPASRFVGVGGSASFWVSARGDAPLHYQWRKDGHPIAGATNRNLLITDAILADAGLYSAMVGNSAGQAISAEAALTVAPPPVILVQPRSQTISCGEWVTFSVVATSSLPCITQVFTRVSSGSAPDWFYLPAANSGTLHIRYNFAAEPDVMQIYALAEDTEEQWLGGLTTNGTGTFSMHYTVAPNSQLAIVVHPVDPDAGFDGWCYVAEKTASPLRYQWVRHWAEDSWICGEGPVLTLPQVGSWDAGTYSLMVTDAAGSVFSEQVTLETLGPILRITPFACPGNPTPCLQFFWSASEYHLEKTTLLDAGWWEVEGAFNGMTAPVYNEQVFYRLRFTEYSD